MVATVSAVYRLPTAPVYPFAALPVPRPSPLPYNPAFCMAGKLAKISDLSRQLIGKSKVQRLRNDELAVRFVL